MRKIIQIGYNQNGKPIHALCNDGTTLQMIYTSPAVWMIDDTPIPQPDPPAPGGRPISHKMVCAALYAKCREHPKDGWSAQSLENMRVILEAAWAAEE